MADQRDSGIFFIKRPEVARGVVVITPDAEQPYKVVFRMGERILSERPVSTVREGEALIRRELAEIQFTAREERPNPEAPPKRLTSVE
jgi:hypothetical protein